MTIEENKEEIDNLTKKKQQLADSKKQTEEAMDTQIGELTEQINYMTLNFEQKLKQTLENMKQRITEANKAWEAENDTKLLDKFKEIVENGSLQHH